jgi:hypothetical protein
MPVQAWARWRWAVFLAALLLAALAVAVILYLTFWSRGRPAVKYQPGDANAAAGQTTEWAFDADPAGGLPPGAEVFGGEWEVRAEAALTRIRLARKQPPQFRERGFAGGLDRQPVPAY